MKTLFFTALSIASTFFNQRDSQPDLTSKKTAHAIQRTSDAIKNVTDKYNEFLKTDLYKDIYKEAFTRANINQEYHPKISITGFYQTEGFYEWASTVIQNLLNPEEKHSRFFSAKYSVNTRQLNKKYNELKNILNTNLLLQTLEYLIGKSNSSKKNIIYLSKDESEQITEETLYITLLRIVNDKLKKINKEKYSKLDEFTDTIKRIIAEKVRARCKEDLPTLEQIALRLKTKLELEQEENDLIVYFFHPRQKDMNIHLKEIIKAVFYEYAFRVNKSDD